MPTSHPAFISEIVKFVMNARPLTILDVGCGFGKWGFLFREYCEVYSGRPYSRQHWTVVIDAIEVFKPYIQDYHKYFYDNIKIADIRKEIDKFWKYDVIIMTDVIEHMSKEDGLELLKKMVTKCKFLIITTPDGFLAQPGVYDNKYEQHVSGWTLKDFKGFRVIKSMTREPVILVIIRGNVS